MKKLLLVFLAVVCLCGCSDLPKDKKYMYVMTIGQAVPRDCYLFDGNKLNVVFEEGKMALKGAASYTAIKMPLDNEMAILSSKKVYSMSCQEIK